ncbi:MAG: hypothetical protein ACR2F2_10785 [Pyrinomonadaceae bacterium]
MNTATQIPSTKSNLNVWQIQINGQIQEANLEQVKEWILKKTVLPEDKVRYGNLRWMEAGKLPQFRNLFTKEQLNAFQRKNSNERNKRDFQNKGAVKREKDRISNSKRISFQDVKYALEYPVNYLTAFLAGGFINTLLAFYGFIGFAVLFTEWKKIGILVIVSSQLLAMVINISFTDKTIRNSVDGRFEDSYMINFLDFLNLKQNILKPLVCSITTMLASFIPLIITCWSYHSFLFSSEENRTFYEHIDPNYLHLMAMNKELTIFFFILLIVSVIIGCGLFAAGLIISSGSENMYGILNPMVWLDVLFDLKSDFLKIGGLIFLFYVFVLIASSLLIAFVDSPVLTLSFQIIGQYILFFAYIFTSVLCGTAMFKARKLNQSYGLPN